ncbi:MAG: VanZ family protein [Oscillospiraceae bacterium]|nr:VanZ family protein [Oscillospiraceae bacterium]
MIRTGRKLRLCVTLLTLNLMFIWGNSLLPAELSGAISQWVKDVIVTLFPGLSGAGDGHGLLRKIAHFTEFTSLGICLCWLICLLDKQLWFSLISGFLAACVDETIQRFVPGRGPSFRDVILDTAGVAFGLILFLIGCAIFRSKRKLRRNSNNEKTDDPDPDTDNGGSDSCRMRRQRQ